MNEIQKAFLGSKCVIFHHHKPISDIYNINDIYSNRQELKKIRENSTLSYHSREHTDNVLLQQQKFGNKESIIIISKALEYSLINYENSSITINAKKSEKSVKENLRVAMVDLNYDEPIKSIELHFEREIIDKIVLIVEMEKAEYVAPVKMIPPIETSCSLGESFVNITYKNIPEESDKIAVNLYDKNKDLMGTFHPKPEMYFIAITDLAYGIYHYKVIAYKENELILESEIKSFNLARPNYSGKPIR